VVHVVPLLRVVDILEGKLREGQTAYVDVKNRKLEFKEKLVVKTDG
jgi:hypothetical protein